VLRYVQSPSLALNHIDLLKVSKTNSTFKKKRHKGVIAATGRPLCNAAGHCDRWLHTHHQVTVFAGFDYFRPNMM